MKGCYPIILIYIYIYKIWFVWVWVCLSVCLSVYLYDCLLPHGRPHGGRDRDQKTNLAIFQQLYMDKFDEMGSTMHKITDVIQA